jgi:hypothetical protein
MPTTLNNEGIKFPDNSTQTSAKTLLAEVPIASGTTVTAGRVISIDSTGAVGAYPVPNAVTETAVAVGANDDGFQTVNFAPRGSNSSISPQGTRALGVKLIQSGYNTTAGALWQYKGHAITANSVVIGAATANLAVNRGSTGYFTNQTTSFMNETDAFISLMHGNYAIQSNFRVRLLSVDVNGATTVGSELSFNVDSGSYYSRFNSVKKITNTVSLHGARLGATFAFRYITANGFNAPAANTNVNNTIGRDMIEGGEFRLTANNILLSYTGNRIRRATFTNAASQLTNYLEFSNFIDNIGASAPNVQPFMTDDGARYVVIYRNNISKMELRIYNVSSTTGEPTLAGSAILKEDASVFRYDEIALSFKNNEQFLITFVDAGLYYAQSVDLNANGSIKGLNERQNIGSIRVENVYNPGTDKYWLNYKENSNHKVKHYTVNAYSTIPFNQFGVATETKSSGNVKVIINGIASGFSGLVVGTQYYVNTTLFNGTVTETDTGFLVGVAISTTEIKLV